MVIVILSWWSHHILFNFIESSQIKLELKNSKIGQKFASFIASLPSDFVSPIGVEVNFQNGPIFSLDLIFYIRAQKYINNFDRLLLVWLPMFAISFSFSFSLFHSLTFYLSFLTSIRPMDIKHTQTYGWMLR